MPLSLVASGDMPDPHYGHPMDPRLPLYSRTTPDALRARLDAALSHNRIGYTSEWAAGLLAAHIGRMTRYEPRRRKLLHALEATVDRVEKERAEKKRKVELSSPAAAPLLLTREETAVNALRSRSRCGAEAIPDPNAS